MCACVCVMIYTLNVCLELLQSHSKVQSHDDWSLANVLTRPTGFIRHIRVSWKCMLLKVRVSSLSLFCLHGSGKLVKSYGGLNCVFKNFSILRYKNCSQDQSLIEFRVWLEFRFLMQRIDSKRAEKERTQAIIQVPSTNRK